MPVQGWCPVAELQHLDPAVGHVPIDVYNGLIDVVNGLVELTNVLTEAVGTLLGVNDET